MSSGNGDGAGFFDDIINIDSLDGGNFFEGVGNDFLNATVQTMTGGYVGFEDGKFSNGVTTNAFKKVGKEVVSGTKEITGAKAAEEANKLARQQFEQATAQADQQRATAQFQQMQNELTQSNMAGRARNMGKNSVLGQDEKDFLGL